jgi:thiol-disulfide isomerase/thioredoxin
LLVFALIAIPASVVAYFAASAVVDAYRLNEQITAPDGAANPLGSYAFSFRDVPQQLPDLKFVDAQNHPVTLASFRGRPLLLNIWATWCVPCRKEMPSLDRLQALVPPNALTVLTLSIDRQGVEAVKAFYDELHLRSLSIYVDPSSQAAAKLGLSGVPGTLLIDAQGREIGRKLGPAEWDSPEVLSILNAKLGITLPAKGASPT